MFFKKAKCATITRTRLHKVIKKSIKAVFLFANNNTQTKEQDQSQSAVCVGNCQKLLSDFASEPKTMCVGIQQN